MASTVEDVIQSEMFRWWDETFPDKRKQLFHVPNGGTRDKREAVKFRGMGVVPGVSDLILVGNKVIFFLEVKTETGTQSHDQLVFEAKVTFLGHVYKVLRNLDEFKSFVWQNIGAL